MVIEQCELQEAYCKENKLPRFAPKDGICYYCNGQIYGENARQISTVQAATKLVTGCPLCHRSYCD